MPGARVMTSTPDQPHSTRLEGWVAVVLAAGRGTRMRSSLPKVLHPVAGRPMVDLVLDTLAEAGCSNVVVVTATADDEVARAVEARARIAPQGEPSGIVSRSKTVRYGPAGTSSSRS